MTVTLDLPPEVELRLRQKAARQGQDIEQYLRTLAEQDVRTERSPLSLEEFDAILDELADGSENRPVLPPGAFERESFYGERA